MSFLHRRFSWLPKALPDGLRSKWWGKGCCWWWKKTCVHRETVTDFGSIPVIGSIIISKWCAGSRIHRNYCVGLTFCVCVCVLPKHGDLWVRDLPSCPRLRRTISCLAPMLPSMASSSLAFISLDFLKVRLFIRSNAFFPCMVNTTWALYPWGRGWVDRQRTKPGSYLHHSTQQAKQV